jgi:hypothetical protein
VSEETTIADADEAGTDKYVYREYGYAPRGEKAAGKNTNASAWLQVKSEIK